MISKVETFEHNIAEEIKMKEASLTEISAASNNVGNDPVELPKKPPVFFIALVTFFILCLLGFGLLGYFYVTGLSPNQEEQPLPVVVTTPKAVTDLATLSPTLSGQIGRFVTTIDKKEQGYILTINSYSPVFAYMTRNENAYIEELASVFAGRPAATMATSSTETATQTPQVAAITPVATTTPSPATSTQNTATSSKIASSSMMQATSTEAPLTIPTNTDVSIFAPQVEASFSDITISNQNMRVWTSGKNTVVYAFVGNNTVLISNSKEGILALKGAILR